MISPISTPSPSGATLLWLPTAMQTESTKAAKPSPPWPTPNSLMFHGIAGEFVRLVGPQSEADLVALLLQFLTAFGNALGRQAFFMVEGAQHCLNLFCLVVAETSKGRKGTSWQHVQNGVQIADPEWRKKCISSGLSSGEGLIWVVRDPIDTGGKRDAGVKDKRLLVVEPEFASALRVMKRDGSTLSAIVRKAWDDGKLTSLTKNSLAQATDAHISVIGHITSDELRRELNRTEIANGFVNRFLLICAKRSKILPEGGNVDRDELTKLGQRLKALLQPYGELRRDEAARAHWGTVYEALSEGKPGMFGAVTSRAEAQVARLACVYAVLDGSRIIKREHLEAALALWQYAEDSARYLFGDSLGDPDADTILAAGRPAGASGLTRTQINRLFSGNRKAEAIETSLQLLEKHRLARSCDEKTRGRPSERWVF